MIDFSGKTYASLLESMLARISNSYDKRDTSPIQTAVGPAAYGLEEFYLELDKVQKSAFISTAEGDDLDELAVIGGLSRSAASAAVRLGLFDTEIPIGSRFSTINGEDSINFSATATYTRALTVSVSASLWEASSLGGVDGSFIFTYADGWTYNDSLVALSTYGVTASGSYVDGDVITVTRSDSSVTAEVTKSASVYSYMLTAETVGTVGNEYTGAILPITVIQGLTSAQIADILVLGDDVEDDDSLRERLIEALNSKSFAGNVTAYKEHVGAIDGVGAVQVYPCGITSTENPTGAGTVSLSVLGTDYLPASDYLVSEVQEDIDPTGNKDGIGYAPIGATVTVMAPTSVSINVKATLVLQVGVSISQIQDDVIEAISNYLLSVRESWADNVSTSSVQYTANVYRALVTSAIVNVPGVLNASSVTMSADSGEYGTSDITLTETGLLQQVPVLGTVTLNE